MKENKITYDQGKYVFEIGASSKDIKGSVTATMNGKLIPVLKTVVADCGIVVLKNGASAQTSVTAAMTDDSFYDISKAEVVYTTNNPTVAVVDEKGLVTAKGTGVATVTTAVTINGKTVSDDFPVKVMPDLNLASVTINNKPVKGFNPKTVQYSYLLSSASKSPVIKATPVDPNIIAEVIQPKTIPGTATITLIDPITNDHKEYVLSFGIKPVSDEFNSNIPGKQWTWVRENPANRKFDATGGKLVITSEEGDVSTSVNNAKNLLLQSANTDWTIESKIACSRKPAGFTENAGIIAYQDDDNLVKLVYRANMSRRGMQRPAGSGEQPGILELSVENRGYQIFSTSVSMDGIIKSNNTLILKLVKKGSYYSAYYTVDGTTYELVGEATVLLKDIKAGVIACNGALPPQMARFARMMQQNNQAPETPFEVGFDYFRITGSGLK